MPPKATKETVLGARDQLIASNKKVTWRAIEAITGGSQSTIGRLLREIDDDEARKPTSPKVREALDAVWAEAVEAAGRLIADRLKQADVHMKEAEGQVENLEQLTSKLQDERDRAVAQREEMLQTLTKNGAECDRLRLLAKAETEKVNSIAGDLARAREQQAAAAIKASEEIRAAEARATKLANDSGAAQLEAMRIQNSLEQRLGRLESEAAMAKVQVEELRAREAALSQELAGTRKRLESEREKFDQVRAEYQSREDRFIERIATITREKDLEIKDHVAYVEVLKTKIAVLERYEAGRKKGPADPTQPT